ncbi:MAG TPA: N-acetyl-alpha-D-glucosaminyl L-malate synthase BshA [Candidatus Acidoferrales bacterium]|nr:N-acetyl-alpha-D-glucosaminyl L-malate synthase BshA [Candidatus Acidoferrales bacterium]
MKIGITCYPTYGGSGVVATELGKALALRGHQIHFISYSLPARLDNFVGDVFYHEVEMSQYPLFDFPLYTDSLASKMVDVAKYHDLDILHVHYAIPHATSAFIAKQILAPTKDIKVITTLHGTDVTLVGLEPSFLPLVKFSIEQSDYVTSVSRFLQMKTNTMYNIEKEIQVIPNFVDTEKFQRKKDCQFKPRIAQGGEKIIVHVSNFRAVKRVPDVIRIFDIIRKTIPSKLVLVGDGPDRSESEHLARELGIFEDVKFLGKQILLSEILSSSDLMLMPSQSESFGLSALEAMSCSVPVVSSSTGGLPELITHGETGYIAELGDVQRMAKYAIELLSDDRKWELFSQNSRKRAVEKFNVNSIVPLYEKLYEEALSQTGVSVK